MNGTYECVKCNEILSADSQTALKNTVGWHNSRDCLKDVKK